MTRDEGGDEGRTQASGGSVRVMPERSRIPFVGGLALRNWGVRRRLVAVVLVPVVAAAALGGLRIASSWDSARDYQRAEQLAELETQASALVHRLQLERDLVAGYIARGRSGNSEKIDEQRQQVDAASSTVRERIRELDAGGVLGEKLRAAENQLQNLSAVRETAMQSELPALAAIQAYSEVVSALLDLAVEVPQDSGNRQLQEQVRAVTALSRAKEEASHQRALLYAAAENGQFGSRGFQNFLLADAREGSALNDFEATATVDQRQQFDDTVTGPYVDQAARLETKAVSAGNSGGEGAELDVDAATWFDAAGARTDLMREVEAGQLEEILSHSRSLQADARVGALRDVGVVLLVIALALLLALVVARSMTRPLRVLRSSALDVAEERLPDVVRQLQETDGRNADTAVERTNLHSRDEIGQVARAFDEVHAEAVRLATEQAALRGNVNAMFVNLSRRSQGLVERQLRLIDELEDGEQDPNQLASLFKLDHLATRMRRHGENLLVLAGEEPGRRWGKPIPLVDVLRAAISEVEQYERVELRGLPGVSLAGRAVNDMVHLVAELLENATAFSAKEAKVVVTSEELGDGRMLLEISDSGIGMGADELAAANERLASQPIVDVSVSRRMGLFVVGRLAWRHGIRVQLRTSDTGGVSALIMLAEDLIHADTPAPASGANEQAAPDTAAGSVAAGTRAQGSPMGAPSGAATSGQLGPAEAQPGQATPAAARPPAASPPAATPASASGTPVSPAGEQPATADQAAAPDTAELASGTGPSAGQHTDPGGAPVTRVDSRPVYGQGPATDPAAAPVQPHPTQGQYPGSTGPIGSPERATSPSGAAGSSVPPESQGSNGTPAPDDVQPSGQWGMSAPNVEPAERPPEATRPGGTSADGTDPGRRMTDSGNIFEEVGLGTTEERRQALPIFDSIQSEWFRQRSGARGDDRLADSGQREDPLSSPAWSEPRSQRGGGERTDDRTGDRTGGEPETQSWRSPGDEAWRTAEETVSAPASGGVTSAGLPKRVPGSNFVPGSAGESAAGAGQQRASRSPEEVGGRLASYHRGIRRGRHEGREMLVDEHPPVESQREQENV